MDWKVFVAFGAKDEISGAVKQAQKNTETSAKGMSTSMGKAGKAVDGLKGKFADMGSIAKGVALGNIIAAGVTKAVGQIKGLISTIDEFADRCDNIRVSALKIGLSSEQFQALAYAANTSNVTTEKLTAGFSNLNKTLGSGALVKHLGETNSALASQVKNAKNNEQASMAIADALSKETDVTKRAALGNAAFGKSWADLYPMMAQGAEGIRAATDSIPNLINDRQIAGAQLWNNTIAEIKRNLQAFGDVIRNAVIQYVGPYVLALQDWIAANREMIKQKIAEVIQKAVVVFQKVVGVIRNAIEKVQKIISFFREWGRVILVVVGVVGALWGFLTAVVAIKNAIAAAKAAMAIFNAVMAANPLILIIAVIAAVVAGFMLLAKKVGGVGPALTVLRETFFKMVLTPINLLIDAFQAILPTASKVVAAVTGFLEALGQTIMKVLLTPINLVIEGIKGILVAASKLPGVGGYAKDALEAIGDFQGKMNTMLTGTESTLFNSGLNAFADPSKAAAAGMADKIAAAEASATTRVEGIQGLQDAMNMTLTGSTSTLTSDPSGFLFDSYDRHRSAYLAENPEAVGIEGDEETAKWDEMIRLLTEQNKMVGDQTVAIEDLADASPASPKNLRWQCWRWKLSCI